MHCFEPWRYICNQETSYISWIFPSRRYRKLLKTHTCSRSQAGISACSQGPVPWSGLLSPCSMRDGCAPRGSWAKIPLTSGGSLPMRPCPGSWLRNGSRMEWVGWIVWRTLVGITVDKAPPLSFLLLMESGSREGTRVGAHRGGGGRVSKENLFKFGARQGRALWVLETHPPDGTKCSSCAHLSADRPQGGLRAWVAPLLCLNNHSLRATLPVHLWSPRAKMMVQTHHRSCVGFSQADPETQTGGCRWFIWRWSQEAQVRKGDGEGKHKVSVLNGLLWGRGRSSCWGALRTMWHTPLNRVPGGWETGTFTCLPPEEGVWLSDLTFPTPVGCTCSARGAPVTWRKPLAKLGTSQEHELGATHVLVLGIPAAAALRRPVRSGVGNYDPRTKSSPVCLSSCVNKMLLEQDCSYLFMHFLWLLSTNSSSAG